ncbi:MAG: ribosome recycling factor [Candidatus Taylorbacteria bacterium]|nr:ribosome recycling factor [Candidatus Taylorbacteria bacterium]
MSPYNFTSLKNKGAEAEEWLKRENLQIRTSRASPSILDAVRVESYGSMVPLREVSTLSVEDPRTIVVLTWDEAQNKAIEKAVIAANLGLSVSVNERGVRVGFPPLTAERRSELSKLAKRKFEEAKISVRQKRDEVWNEIQKLEKSKVIGEDEKFRLKNEMQKIVDEIVTKLDALSAKKQKEILGI